MTAPRIELRPGALRIVFVHAAERAAWIVSVQLLEHHPAIAQKLLFVALARLRLAFAIPLGNQHVRIDLEILEQVRADRFGTLLTELLVELCAAARIGVALDLEF